MYNSTPVQGVSGINKSRMVFTDTVVNAYSSGGYEVSADFTTQSTMKIATLVNCKTLGSGVTGLNGLTTPDADYVSNPLLGCMSNCDRGSSTIEFFG